MITSTENQETYNKRVWELLKIPAVIHGLSCEPLLGPIDLDLVENGAESEEEKSFAKPTELGMRLDWVIAGGESGTSARPCDIEWLRVIQHHCRLAGVPYFCKQLGSKPVDGTRMSLDYDKIPLQPLHRKGGNPSEWPVDMRVREFPKVTR